MKVMAGVVVLGIAFIVGYLVLGRFSVIPIEAGDPKFCLADSDCVPAQCCHPTDAVNVRNAPDCRDVACTLECRAGTLDCGQGEVRCVSNRCTALINR